MGRPDQLGPDQRLLGRDVFNGRLGLGDGWAERSLVGYSVKQYE